MKNYKPIKLMISSLAVTGCTILFQQATAQNWSNYGAGHNYDRWTVNGDNSNDWSHLRLQASNTHAWNLLNEGDLWWGYSPNGDHNDRGVEKMRLTIDGKLGIGTDSPQGKLHLIHTSQDAGGGALILGPTNASNLRLGYHTDYSWIQSHFNKPLAINPIGSNVGIGTTTPTAKLDVAGDLYLTSGSRVFKGAAWVSNAAGSLANFLANDVGFYGVSGSHLQFVTGQQDRMRITGSGNVGIGTTSPRGRLDVTGGDTYLTDNTNAGTGQSIFLPGHIYLSPYNGSNVTYLQARRQDNSGTTSLRLRTYNNGVLTEAMQIQGNGNVGIGTVAPTEKLEVVGNLKANGVILNIGTFPDYVFENDYRLMPLNEVERYIKTHKHLPGFPSGAEVIESGANLGQLNTLLVEKVEELTLHTIAQEKQLETLTGELALLKEQLHQLLEKQ